MTSQLTQIELAAVNIDGVLLNDTFSPVIHRFITRRGGHYSEQVERAIFSQGQLDAAAVLGRAAGLDASPQDVLKSYFDERAEYLAENPIRLLDGAVALLRTLRGLGLRTVCYGGLGRDHFDRYLGEYADLFDAPGYICTNSFRPGIKEITTEYFRLDYRNALFIDDVARVAEEAKRLGVAFIGHPSHFAFGHQRALMTQAGARHIVGSLSEIDESLLRAVDAEATAGTC
ncbi:HAD family phosphatase [Streptomyces sp. NBC_00388]|uniref:HAD family phosphatase n=1 Tax=Streptomyces sp. NBC_00388 TaxID=2975735 RepID=UPI002E1F6B81